MTTQPVARGEAIDFNLECMTVEQGLQLIEDERVKPLLQYLKTGVFENKTNMTFMKAYSVVVQFGDQQQHSYKLYSYYKKVITEYCEENVTLMKDDTGEELLRKLSELWEKNTILVFWMQRVFQYLDRFFTKTNNNVYPDLFSAALRSFQECVYDKVKDKCLAAMIATINKERDRYDIDQEVMRTLVEMLCTVGDACPSIVKTKGQTKDQLSWQSNTRGFYKTDFETLLISSTADYYKAKVTGWLAEYSCPAFLEEVQRRIADEERRLAQYLNRSSEQELRTVTNRELILNTAKRLVEMDSGCKAMFQNNKYDEMKLMYKLFKREPSMLPNMTAIMEPYIEERCTKIVEDQKNIDEPPIYIEKVLELKRELDEMVGSCFENDSGFQKARNRGLENVLNKDTRCAKYLAYYSDQQLKKGLKGKREEEMNDLVTQVVGLFAHLNDKDVFLDFYKRNLSRRLLTKCSVSNDAEDYFISKLKVECGQQAIQKLASMFTDMSLSDQLQEEYNKLSHNGSPGGITHEVRVLQTNAWPEKPDDAAIAVCDEMHGCIQAFENFYASKHTGRKLRWIYNMGQVELACPCFTKKHILVVSTYQGICLMLFNKCRGITFQEICNHTKIPKEECKRQVKSLTVGKARVLLKDGDPKEKDIEDHTVLKVNTDFTSDKVKVMVQMLKKDEKQQEATVAAETPMERKHIIDAAVVRIMKSRKKLEHNQLLDEVFRQCTMFKPQPSQVKMQIEHLIEREFLKRDEKARSTYIYLP